MTGLGPHITLAEAASALTANFAAAGIDTPGIDARLLLEAAAGVTREALVLAPGRRLSAAQTRSLAAMAARRIAREPVSRILGERFFWGRPFVVTPATLDPRPDTEALIELALGLVREAGWSGNGLRILDVGTGTGAILLTLLAEIEGATGLGTDISADAIAVAARNAEALGLTGRADWLQARSLENIGGRFDLVVSNPPYIESADLPLLDPEVRKFDPLVALDGGSDGMDIVREIVERSAEHTTDHGWCILEIGAGQAATAAGIVKKHRNSYSLCDIRFARDLGGLVRCVAWQPHF